ncbi:unnamed protein product, partial [Dibothriocephalus latus]
MDVRRREEGETPEDGDEIMQTENGLNENRIQSSHGSERLRIEHGDDRHLPRTSSSREEAPATVGDGEELEALRDRSLRIETVRGDRELELMVKVTSGADLVFELNLNFSFVLDAEGLSKGVIVPDSGTTASPPRSALVTDQPSKNAAVDDSMPKPIPIPKQGTDHKHSDLPAQTDIGHMKLRIIGPNLANTIGTSDVTASLDQRSRPLMAKENPTVPTLIEDGKAVEKEQRGQETIKETNMKLKGSAGYARGDGDYLQHTRLKEFGERVKLMKDPGEESAKEKGNEIPLSVNVAALDTMVKPHVYIPLLNIPPELAEEESELEEKICVQEEKEVKGRPIVNGFEMDKDGAMSVLMEALELVPVDALLQEVDENEQRLKESGAEVGETTNSDKHLDVNTAALYAGIKLCVFIPLSGRSPELVEVESELVGNTEMQREGTQQDEPKQTNEFEKCSMGDTKLPEKEHSQRREHINGHIKETDMKVREGLKTEGGVGDYSSQFRSKKGASEEGKQEDVSKPSVELKPLITLHDTLGHRNLGEKLIRKSMKECEKADLNKKKAKFVSDASERKSPGIQKDEHDQQDETKQINELEGMAMENNLPDGSNEIDEDEVEGDVKM